jgi:hypothetical protein
MENNYDTELDFVLEELIVDYENQFKGIKFYSDEYRKKMSDEIGEKLKIRFGLKDWEIDLLYHNLFMDKYIKSVDSLSISLDGIVFRNNGGYTERRVQRNTENLRIQKLEKSTQKNALGLVIFTALLAIGTLISAWYFGIEIWRYYHSTSVH